MINYQKLSANRPILEVLSLLIDYPTEDTFTEANRTLIEQDKALSKDERRSLLEIFDQLAKPVLLKQQTNYTGLFEMNRRYTLYMSYYKMTDSRERGTVLAKLKMLYEMFGVAETTSELSDYLPLMLDFLAVGDFLDDPRRKDIQLALSVIEDGTYNLLKNAVIDSENPYIKLVKFIREIVGSSVETEVKTDAQ
ncbi:nitrate reductase molybdenum cofactor assembly chaperone [Limosilactobacillus panis]|uniref:Nitrate reductase n=1 Tax=Limosilactobacillus panis DSM 6035 TaxID=1423782 RepID=A0A0R1XHS8_9LACO|nr:nitrate reductase molybdenum cofactor assembly chaperone [Limosilactobacillus panis]KRM29767.1 nitrate reductase [Limosilactobacillus panis DSM 6035]